MLPRVIHHARHNVIAYLALGCSLLALAGGAYAAVALPANSVGARQIRNNSITPAKFNHTAIGGTILHWAQVDATGRVVAGSHGARELAPLNSTGTYEVTWGGTIPTRCTVMTSVLRSFPPAQPAGFVTAIKAPGPKRNGVLVNTLDVRGAPSQVAFSVAVIC